MIWDEPNVTVKIRLNGKQLEEVSSFKHLGAITSGEGSSEWRYQSKDWTGEVKTDGKPTPFPWQLRGRSQLSTFMKAYTAYARGEGVWDHRMLSPRKSTFIFNHWQCIIKYCTCLECEQYAHICRSFMYNNTLGALFLTSKCTKRGFLWTQTVAPHRRFCKAAQRRYRIFSTWADSSSQNRTKPNISLII